MADPATANEQLQDLLVRHQIYLAQFSNGMYRRLTAILSKADSELVEKIAAKATNSWSKRRLEALLAAIRELNQQAVDRLERGMRQELVPFAEYESQFTADTIQRVVPIKLDVVQPAAVTLKAVVTTDPIAGSILSEAVADWGVARERRVREAVRLGVVEGETIDQIVRRVRGTRALQYKDGILDISRRDAQAVVRTAVQNVATGAREALYDENPDLIKGVKWVSTLDSRTTPICRARDGKVYELGKGPRPPAHWNCRSTTVPVMKSWKDLGVDLEEAPAGTRASLNGQVPADMTYGEWLKRQPREVVTDIMGVKKGALFLDGNLPMDRFVDEAGRELTLDQLKVKERAAWGRAFGGQA